MGSGKSLEYCDLSDIGRRRANNQDARAVLDAWSPEQYRQRGWLFLVADGMGAHAAGEMASALAAQRVPFSYEKLAYRSPPLALRSSIQQANAEIHTRGETAADLKGMGTTCTVLVIGPRGALVGHVGDSRAYRIRADRIEQLSCDHSLAWEVEAARSRGGELTPEVSQHVPKNIITRSLGPHARVEVDLEGPFPVAAGDSYVVCSDGLSGQVADDEIGALAATLSPADAAAALLGLALVRGAPDNVTLVVARTGPKEQTDSAAAALPWPLTEGPESDRRHLRPWKPLVVAAASLLASLILLGIVFAPPPAGEEGLPLSLSHLLALCGAGGFGLVCLASLLLGLGGFLGPADGETRLLRPGARLGKGPYREFDCSLTPALVEGVVTSVEAAADGLSDAERTRALDRVAAARRAAAADDLPTALGEAAKAIAVYRTSVVAARQDDTIRTTDDL